MYHMLNYAASITLSGRRHTDGRFRVEHKQVSLLSRLFRVLVVAGFSVALAEAVRLDVENGAVVNKSVDGGDSHGAVIRGRTM